MAIRKNYLCALSLLTANTLYETQIFIRSWEVCTLAKGSFPQAGELGYVL